MKFFIDSADINEIKKAMDMGLVDGVTTNPSLISKTGRPAVECLKEICSVVDGPVSAEVLATDTDGILAEGRKLAALADNIVIKAPMTIDGLRAVRQFTDEGILTNVTLVFHPTQALMAAKAGATFVSPFIGRLDDITTDGMQLIEDIMTIFWNYEIETEVLVASIRHPMHVLDAARIGADVATIPFAVIEKLAKHPLTDIGLEKFLADAKKIPGKYI